MSSVKQQIDADLKAALLGGDKTSAVTLRGLKSAILNAEIADGKRDVGLSDEETTSILRKEVKKRQESAILFRKGNNPEKAQGEETEIELIEKYLPKQLSDEELGAAVDQALAEAEEASLRHMGKIIARTKELTKGAADGSRIAAAVKQRIQQ